MSKPSNCISVQKAKDLQSNWNKTRAIAIERSMGSKDVCAVTFNIDQLQQFIDYVKNGTPEGPNPPGIRVYLAAYDTVKTDKATVFLCATESDSGNSDNNYNLDPLNMGQDGWPPKAY